MTSVCVVCVCVGGSERRGRPDRAARARGCTDVLECERMGSEELVVRWWWDRGFWGGLFPSPAPWPHRFRDLLIFDISKK